MFRKFLIPIAIVLFLLFSGGKNKDEVVNGMTPVYIDKTTALTVTYESARPIENAGKIYLYNDYVFINEQYKGVHVVNNSDPSNPQKVGFISIPGNIDISVKSGIMYADNYSDLVVINISNPTNPVILKRVSNVYSNITQMYPSDYTGYFECVDTTQGFVTGWIETELTNPKCFR